jgi:hypothetical protein
MTSRKKPGVAFWATVLAVATTAYVLSFGPAVWIAFHTGIGNNAIAFVYCPLCTLAVYHEGCRHLLAWYIRIGIPENWYFMIVPNGIIWIH